MASENRSDDEVIEEESLGTEGYEEEAAEDESLDDDEVFEEEEEDEGQDEILRPKGKSYDPQRQIDNLSQVTHESNDSLRRRRKRTKINKIMTRLQKPRKRRSVGGVAGFDYSADFDPRSEAEDYTGHIQIADGGFGFMRSERINFQAQDADIVIPRDMVNRFGLRSGHKIQAVVRQKRNHRQRVVAQLIAIQDEPIETWRQAPLFHTLTSVNPHEFYRLSSPQDVDKSMVLLELLTPIGKGQRGLIVAPPRTGKTMLMEKIANGIAFNHPDADMIVLLIDERPEEVTHLQRRVNGKVYASCLDRPIEEHIALTQMVLEMVERKVERGRDVVILLDSITRMSRAYNNQLKSSGRTLSGGVDAKALMEPKKFFGAARKLEEGGSLTIIATALVQTGSQMDEVIFQEFKGTGNMELALDKKLAERRVWPAIDISMSGTRREELLHDPETLHATTMLRRTLTTMNPVDAMEQLTKQLRMRKSNAEFLKLISGARILD
jgi:transcription termination factor Rho